MASRAGPSTLRHTLAGENEASDLVSLTARLTLQDIQEIESRQKGKRNEGAPMTDAELALRLAAEEARSSVIFDSDRAIAQRLQESDDATEFWNVRR
jgi:hypothetical protein